MNNIFATDTLNFSVDTKSERIVFQFETISGYMYLADMNDSIKCIMDRIERGYVMKSQFVPFAIPKNDSITTPMNDVVSDVLTNKDRIIDFVERVKRGWVLA
jgi:hypothetical protein